MINFLTVLFSPMAILFLLICGCLVQELATINTLQRGSRRRKPRWLLLITIIWFFTITTKPVPVLLTGFLDNRYPVFDTLGFNPADTIIYIILPVECNHCDSTSPHINKINHISLGRLVEAVRIHEMFSNSYLVTFGHGGRGLACESGIIVKAAVQVGADSTRIYTLDHADTMWRGASRFTGKFGIMSRVIIVTDAMSMIRAMKIYREFGHRPTAAPVNFAFKMTTSDSMCRWLPSTRNINIMTSAMNELMGLVFFNLFLSGNHQSKS
jgi:uncharacterized SAM-binding protein YcdF (DUF218 family)